MDTSPVNCRSKSRDSAGRNGQDSPRSVSALQRLIDEYLHEYGNCYALEDRWWGDQTLTWDQALERAWNSRFHDGKMHGHQRRVSPHLVQGLEMAWKDGKRPEDLASFEELHVWITSVTARIHGLGKTTAYDVARRLGAWLKLEPSTVYLHAGTGEGAAKFGIRGHAAPLTAFPPEIQALGAMHAENFLCIFKNRLGEAIESSAL